MDHQGVRNDHTSIRLTNCQLQAIVDKNSTEKQMHIITWQRFKAAMEKHPNDASGIERTYKLLEKSEPTDFIDLQALFGVNNVDNFKPRNQWFVIDIGGNNLRLIGYIRFGRPGVRGTFFTKHIYTHAEYNKANKWYQQNEKGERKP